MATMDREKYVRSHPKRARILALYEEDEGRSLAAFALRGDLAEEVTPAVVAYHVRVLQDAGLLPKDE
jgi:DNA-binding transcriptional ArsR family regulator